MHCYPLSLARNSLFVRCHVTMNQPMNARVVLKRSSLYNRIDYFLLCGSNIFFALYDGIKKEPPTPVLKPEGLLNSLRSWRDYNAGILFWRRVSGEASIGLVLILLAAPPPIFLAGLPHTVFNALTTPATQATCSLAIIFL